MQKKYILLVIGLILIIVIFALFLLNPSFRYQFFNAIAKTQQGTVGGGGGGRV